MCCAQINWIDLLSPDGPPRFLLAGDSALVVEFGEGIDAALNRRVVALDEALAQAGAAGVIETAPTYRSLMIHYDPDRTSAGALKTLVEALAARPAATRPNRRWRVPACYEPPYAEDIDEVAQMLGVTARDVAALHAGAVYRVFMYGFAPGYLFLGGLPAELAISRRPTPRPPIPPGSLLIAGGQALIAHLPMPTGWRQIGRTPARLFDPARAPMVVAEVGDEIVFDSIDAKSFRALAARTAAGETLIGAAP